MNFPVHYFFQKTRNWPLFQILILVFFLTNTLSVASHRVAPAFSMTYIKTTEGDRYNFYSPAINYTGDFKTWNLRLHLSVSILFPWWANQNGDECNMSQYYSSRLGSDLFIGISKNYPIANHLRFIPALGYHLNSIRLRAKPEYMDFYSLSSGLGLNILTRYRWKSDPVNFAFLLIGMDFSDMLYTDNKLKKGYTITIGAGYAF